MLRKIIVWLDDHSPVRCWECSKIILKKNATYEATNVGFIVPLCGECHDMIFHPYHMDK